MIEKDRERNVRTRMDRTMRGLEKMGRYSGGNDQGREKNRLADLFISDTR